MPGLNTIDGINSGLNTAEIVDALLTFERRNIAFLETEQSEKTNSISALQALQAKFLALNSELTRLSRSSTFESYSAQVSDETVLSAAVSGKVGTGSYDIEVLSLARNHQLASQGFGDESLASFGTGIISLSIGGGSTQAITIDAANNSLVGIKKAINDADAGVRATIINDGSSANPYRLVLSANQTGAANSISITASLTGGNNLDFVTSSFDSPETIGMDAGSTSQVTLGAAASYTGSQNKIYTFSVAGSGSQTVGTDTITINWTDGTDSGSFDVTAVDTEVALTGTGSDGLTLSFAAGTLTAGDTFQVGTFSPILQAASDARISIGSSGGSGSPILVTSTNNRFDSLIGGLSLTLHRETVSGQTVTINTDLDVSGVRSSINDFITRYNDVQDYIDEQNTWNQDTNEVGVLYGDFSLRMMQNSLRGVLSSAVSGLEGKYRSLYALGIHTTANGTLTLVSSSRLEEALNNNLDEVVRLFTSSGNSSSSFIEFMSLTVESKPGENYAVDITQAATSGWFQGAGITDPITTPLTLNSTNNQLKLIVDGLTSEDILLAQKTYSSSSELVSEIQDKIDADASIGDRGVTVEWVDSGSGTGYLNLVSSAYGSTSKVELVTSVGNSAYTALGLATGTGHTGDDVAGTINGEEAEGKGQFLTGKEDNETTDGLKLRITLDASQVTSAVEGTITVTQGLAAKLTDLINSFTRSSEGLFDRKVTACQSQIDTLQARINEQTELLEMRRESLLRKFYDMETALGQLGATGSFLTSQLAGLNANWGFNNSQSS
ncbi:MAG: flagellar filament capping protein FliD [bacterium]